MPTQRSLLSMTLQVLSPVLFIIWLGIWLISNVTNNESLAELFTDTYLLVPLFGSINGFLIAQHWGGLKSTFGRVVFYLSAGLLMQALGQFTYAILYIVGGIELAFPSIGDVPYVLSNVAYIYAAMQMLVVLVPSKKYLKPWWILLFATTATLCVLAAAYVGFIQEGLQDDRGVIVRLLNVGYPALQAVYFLLGIVALLHARLAVGGKLFMTILLLLIALVTQYIADYTFLFQAYHDSWSPAGLSDLVFLFAYGLMTLSLLMIDRVRRKLFVKVGQQ